MFRRTRPKADDIEKQLSSSDHEIRKQLKQKSKKRSELISMPLSKSNMCNAEDIFPPIAICMAVTAATDNPVAGCCVGFSTFFYLPLIVGQYRGQKISDLNKEIKELETLIKPEGVRMTKN